MGIRTRTINAGIDEPGSVALDARLLADIVNNFPDDEIHISVNMSNLVEISSGKSVFKIVGSATDEYPALPEVKQDNRFSIRESLLRDMIRQTIISVSGDMSKPALTGELLKVENGIFSIASVDGFRISHREHEVGKDITPFGVIVPGKTLGDIIRLLSGSGESEAVTHYSDKHIMFELESCTIVSRLIEGRFLDYEGTFLTEPTTIVKANRLEMIGALERACLIADSTKRNPITLEIDKTGVIITSNTERGTYREEMAADVGGKKLTIHFNPRYLIDILKVIDDSEISLQCAKELNPCVIQPVYEGNYKYLVLPLRAPK
jgi:DNA polymerase-3 subunit beta